MASRWKSSKNVKASTWRQALLFNALLLLLAVLAANTIVSAYTTSAITNPNSIEARSQTRVEIDRTFKQLRGPDPVARQDWALRIDRAVGDRDFAAARGYLLAAPEMLNDTDANALRAAAAAEESGTQDQRILRAALLFLPDPVRANYQRAISPPAQIPADSDEEPVAEGSEDRIDLQRPIVNVSGDVPGTSAFSILGDNEDLVRLSQSWVGGESRVDDVQLRLRALGLLDQRDGTNGEIFEDGVTVLLTAKRASRLNERFETYLSDRIEDALPSNQLRSELSIAFEPVMTSAQRAEQILTAYEAVLDTEAFERLRRDMLTVSQLAELTNTQGAITLVEQTSSPEDMRRILLVTRAGGDRAVALAQELGPGILDLAQIGVKWTARLILQIMALVAIGIALLMCMLSVLTRADTLTRYVR